MNRSVVVKMMLYIRALAGLENPPELLLMRLPAGRPPAAAAPRIVVGIAQACSRRRRVPVVAVIAAARVPASVHRLVAAVVRGAVAFNVVVLPAALLTTRPVQQHAVSLQFLGMFAGT